jgi:hypothetical protein
VHSITVQSLTDLMLVYLDRLNTQEPRDRLMQSIDIDLTRASPDSEDSESISCQHNYVNTQLSIGIIHCTIDSLPHTHRPDSPHNSQTPPSSAPLLNSTLKYAAQTPSTYHATPFPYASPHTPPPRSITDHLHFPP